MKYALLSCLLSTCMLLLWGQDKDVLVRSEKKKTSVDTSEKGQLQVNVSPDALRKFQHRRWVRYSDFGARGDGKTDDINAIAATHAVANKYGLTVKADKAASYYISGKARTVVIRTNTDFGTATFIIDDTEVQNHGASVFIVSSERQPIQLKTINSLKKNQQKIDLSLPGASLVTVTNADVKRYIRFGPNQNNGSPQTDIFFVDKNGNLDKDVPIIWDFDKITEITALPIDEKTLTITGGRFTTIANNAESKSRYYHRNISIRRSHVVVQGLEHRIIGEGNQGAPYDGFISISDCAFVTVKNTVFTGHKTYITTGVTGKPVAMGSYDILVNRAVNISFVNCRQTNDINDKTYWGIMGSNYCKNLLYDSCTLSRFDAHMGVANATIRNSTLGHMGINAIGTGIFTVENSTVNCNSFMMFRTDYGSTWQGEVIIRNCLFAPAKPIDASVFGGFNSGKHYFGYVCYMPERITLENIRINDANHSASYQGPTIFANFNPEMTDTSYREVFPIVRTREVILRNVTTTSGKKMRLSDNPYYFKNVRVIYD